MKKLIVLLLLVFLICPSVGKCQLNSDGKDFYVGLLYPSFMSQNISSFGRNVQGFYGVYVLLSSYYDNVVTVSYFDDAGKEGFQQTFKIQARRAIQVPLDISRTKMTDPGEMVEYKSCHITALKTINVQYFSTGSCAGGSYLSLPTNLLGKNYIVESYHDNKGGVGGKNSNENSAGYFLVIAAFDGTSVEITPNTTTAKGKIGRNSGDGYDGERHPFKVGLNRGQCYMVKSSANQSYYDISGTLVTSDKPIAVIAGHENAFVDNGSVNGLSIEARDYMVEQMMPCEYWDTAGYVSIPFAEPTHPADGAQGEEYRVFANGEDLENISYNVLNSKYDFSTALFYNPGISSGAQTNPIDFYSTSEGGKFHVMMYDKRNQGSNAPFTSPSMMSIVPMSRWKSSYLWYVANNSFESGQGYYINVICRKVDYYNDSVQIAINGGKLTPLKSAGLSQVTVWQSIPNHLELMGLTYKIGPGAYYATSIAVGDNNKSQVGFMVYNYGFRAIDPDRDLGDNDEDDYYFSYALPVGFSSGSTGKNTISVTVDTLCAKWKVCVKIRGKNNVGLRQVTILDDPNGDIVRPGSKYYNVQFDPSIDPDDTREINLSGNDTDYCLQINVKNPFDTSFCPLYLVDADGNDYLLNLGYKSPKLSVKVLQAVVSNKYDSIVYPVSAPGKQTCATVYYINNGDAKKGDPNIDIKAINLKKNNGFFTVTNVSRPLPTILSPKSISGVPGDTLAVTVCFNSKDTALHLDSLIFENDCFKTPTTLIGQGGTPLIYASNHNFGSVILGESKCDTVTIRNIGNLPFTLTKDWLLHNSTDFSMTAGSSARLPIVLNPNDTIQLRFCFAPTASGYISTTVDWITDIQQPYTDQVKSISTLNGTAIVTGVEWDRSVVKIYADTTIKPIIGIKRMFLRNKGTAKTYVNTVRFVGGDSAEFSIGRNQAGYNPFERFELRPNDSIWIEIYFTPNMDKPEPNRSATRHTKLVANYNRNVSGTLVDETLVDVYGVLDSNLLAVKSYHETPNDNLLSAYQYERRLIATLSKEIAGHFSCELYDVLGRKVYDWQSAERYMTEALLMLPLPKLSQGSYILRLRSENSQLSTKVMIFSK